MPTKDEAPVRSNREDRVPVEVTGTKSAGFQKVIGHDGEVKVVPAVEVAAKAPHEETTGIRVADPTEKGLLVRRPASMYDMAEIKTESSNPTLPVAATPHLDARQAGENVAASEVTVNEEATHDKDPSEGGSHVGTGGLQRLAEDGDGQRKLSRPESANADESGKAASKSTSSSEGGFDVKNPAATPLAELDAAIAGLSDAEVKKAQKADERVGAAAIYEKRLAKE